jgi:ABC-type transport system involved in multi-copper enzyme maturation permease subunit
VSISAPRYVAPTARVGRSQRILAIVRREFLHRSNVATVLVLGLTFSAVILEVTLNVEFASNTGTLSISAFETPYESVVWPFLILIVATAVGAGSVAEDVGNRSIALYLSRPIHLVDYLAAKASAVGSWLLVATIAPGVAAVAVLAALGAAPASMLASAALGFVATGFLVGVFFTGVALAFSSLTNRTLYAGVAIFGVLLSLIVSSEVVSGITGNPMVLYADPVTVVRSVAEATFGLAGPYPADPVVSAIVLLVTGGLLATFAGWRLSRVEVVGE